MTAEGADALERALLDMAAHNPAGLGVFIRLSYDSDTGRWRCACDTATRAVQACADTPSEAVDDARRRVMGGR